MFVLSSWLIFENLLDTCPDGHFAKTVLYFSETSITTPLLLNNEKIPAFPHMRIDKAKTIPSYNYLDDNGINPV